MVGGINEENCVLFLGCVCFALGGIGAVLPILPIVAVKPLTLAMGIQGNSCNNYTAERYLISIELYTS